MVSTSTIIAYGILLTLFLLFPLILQFAIRMRASGKLLCGIVSKDKPLNFKLLKVKGGEFVEQEEDEWLVDTNQVKLVKYPLLWPRILDMFTQIVPCSLYMRGRAEPLDWENPSVGSLSSKELPVILDPHWLGALVKGVTEGGGISKRERMLLYITAGAAIICMVLVFVVLYKMGQ